ncbi:MAG TPA: YfhO family protein [Acidimicrobiales bacterium]|jgi:hypothetical protein
MRRIRTAVVGLLGRTRLAGNLPTVLAAVWLLLVGLAYLAPALARGAHLGPYDILSTSGLGTVPGVTPHDANASDQITQMVPWATMAWHQVHSGHLPLWNPYSALGLPLAFNFQSGVFSLPMLVGYLFPSGLVYTVALVVKLLIAGSGVFFLCRVLDFDVFSSAFAGTVFELSGAFTGWLGWPQSGTFCWLGWLLGAGILVVRRPRRWTVALFSVSLAFAIYGGHPEGLIISACVIGLLLAAVIAFDVITTRSARPLRSLVRLAVSAILGLALASPLLLPSASLVSDSVRNGPGGSYVLSTGSLANFAFSGFFGFPIQHSQYFGSFNYYESAAYVGPVVLVLAALAVWRCWRRVELSAMAVLLLGLGVIVFTVPGAKWIVTLPGANQIIWTRALVPMDFLLAVLGGAGMSLVVKDALRKAVRWRLAALAVLATLAMIAIYLHNGSNHLKGVEAAIRRHSFLWPAISVLVALAVVVWLQLAHRIGPWRPLDKIRPRTMAVTAALALGAVELVFLLTATPQVQPSSPTSFVTTTAEAQLQHIVGTSRVGFSSCPSLAANPSLGIIPEANDVYGLSEISAYDPILPKADISAWRRASGAAATPTFGVFCPSITTAALARQFGVSYVLAPADSAPPSGMHLVAQISNEALYRVPSAGVITLQADSAAAGSTRTQEPVPFTYSGTGTMQFTVDASGPSTLYIHVADLPGWSASIDGHALALKKWGSVMQSASVSPGRHRITISYRPESFTVGLIVAGLAAALLLAWTLLSAKTRRTI